MACTAWSRLRGLRAHQRWGGVLVLAPCSDIHTFGFKRAIDVAFADEEGQVIAAYRDLQPNVRRRARGAQYTLERWSAPDRPWYQPGDVVTLCRVRSFSERKGLE